MMAKLDKPCVVLKVNVKANESPALQKKSALKIPFNPGAWPWATLLSGFAALIAALAYIVGSMFHRLYLTEFHLLSGSYPQDRSETLLDGVLVLNEGIVIFRSWLWSNLPLILLIPGFFIVVGVLWARHRLFLDSNKVEEVVRVHLTRTFHEYLIFFVVIGTCCTVLFFAVPMTIISVAASPTGISQAVATELASRDREAFSKPCGSKTKEACLRLTRNDVEIARGYVIAQSDIRVALFDKGRIQQIPLDGLTLELVSPSLGGPPPTTRGPGKACAIEQDALTISRSR